MDNALMGLPVGFRFHPSDEEIVLHYLIPKAMDCNFKVAVISEADFNKCEPWHLPKIDYLGDTERFYYWKRDWKYPTGIRTNRATKAGYWKATGKDKEIYIGVGGGREMVGIKKTLVFYTGRAPRGEKTNWVMHEYRLIPQFCQIPKNEEWVVSRVFHKSTGDGSNGDMHDARIACGNSNMFSPFQRSASHSTVELLIKDELVSLPPLLEHPSTSTYRHDTDHQLNIYTDTSIIQTPISDKYEYLIQDKSGADLMMEDYLSAELGSMPDPSIVWNY